MEKNNNVISTVRGDSLRLNFQRKDKDGNVIFTLPDKLYFTMKENFDSLSFVIQKNIEDFSMDNDGTWHFTLLPSDTETLEYGTYAYDIEVTETENDYVFTIAKGEIEITKEATWRANK